MASNVTSTRRADLVLIVSPKHRLQGPCVHGLVKLAACVTQVRAYLVSQARIKSLSELLDSCPVRHTCTGIAFAQSEACHFDQVGIVGSKLRLPAGEQPHAHFLRKQRPGVLQLQRCTLCLSLQRCDLLQYCSVQYSCLATCLAQNSAKNLNLVLPLQRSVCLLVLISLHAQMVVAPRHAATQRLLRSELVFVPLALLYLFLLVHSWEPDTLRLILPGSLAEGLKGAAPPLHHE